MQNLRDDLAVELARWTENLKFEGWDDLNFNLSKSVRNNIRDDMWETMGTLHANIRSSLNEQHIT